MKETPNFDLKSIARVDPDAFLVCNMAFEDYTTKSPFVKWLESEGFVYGWYKGNYGNCPWIFVNITRKLYAYGMPGIKIVEPIGNHAITVEEFETIYEIYKKYEGKELFVFHKDRFDYDAKDEDTENLTNS